MGLRTKKVLLLLGDLLLLYLSLFLTLLIRFSSQFNIEIFKRHLIPFSILYFFWIIFFYIFGLFDLSPLKISFLKMLGGLFVNFIFGVVFFYFLPFWGIAPKTILFLNIFVFGVFSLVRFLGKKWERIKI